MRRQPTEQEFEAIMGIVKRVEASMDRVEWGRDLSQATGIYTAITRHKPKLGSCISCHLDMLNALRGFVNLPAITKPVPQDRQSKRMRLCQECPAHRPATQSCGRLFKDAFNPRPILIDGQQVNPCGCYLPAKVKFKHATCPAGKW